MVEKIQKIEEDIKNYISDKTNQVHEMKEYLDNMIHQRYNITKELNSLFKEKGISLYKPIEEANKRIEGLKLQEAALDKVAHQQS